MKKFLVLFFMLFAVSAFAGNVGTTTYIVGDTTANTIIASSGTVMQIIVEGRANTALADSLLLTDGTNTICSYTWQIGDSFTPGIVYQAVMLASALTTDRYMGLPYTTHCTVKASAGLKAIIRTKP